MKRLSIKQPEQVKRQIVEYLRSSEELKFAHKLHGILLLLSNENTNCVEVAKVFGNTPQALALWVHRLNQGEGGNIEVLKDKVKTGRQTRITAEQLKNLKCALGKTPAQYGIDTAKWDGRALSLFLAKEYGIHLKIRMCQRWMQKLKLEKDANDSP